MMMYGKMNRRRMQCVGDIDSRSIAMRPLHPTRVDGPSPIEMASHSRVLHQHSSRVRWRCAVGGSSFSGKTTESSGFGGIACEGGAADE